ncbi:MAG: hypothetical protein LUF78_06075 [Clostridiales bacterium]|nr:hypothetical protein [Clostridiales bacterium]
MRMYDWHFTDNPDWYHRDEFGQPVVNDDAPMEAQISYQHYKQQRAEMLERYEKEDEDEEEND